MTPDCIQVAKSVMVWFLTVRSPSALKRKPGGSFSAAVLLVIFGPLPATLIA